MAAKNPLGEFLQRSLVAPVQRWARMIYVMEFGPLRVAGKKEKQWVVFSVDTAPTELQELISHVAPDQATARRAMSVQLSVQQKKEVQCCESLARFGQGRGWRAARVPLLAWRHAAMLFASLDLRDELGACAFSPELEELLRSCALFLLSRPWERSLASAGQRLPSGEVAAVLGRVGVPALVLLPDDEAYRRAQSRDPQLSGMSDVTLVSVVEVEDPLTRNAFGVGFGLTLLRRKAGKAVPFSLEDLRRVTTTMRLFALGPRASEVEASHGP